MKKAFLLLLPLLFSLAAEKPHLVVAQGEFEAVRDIDGKILRSGTEYYILPVFRGRGGGLTLGPPRNGTCPLDVLQEPGELSRGIPVTFTPVDPKKGVIRVTTDHNIKFSAVTICIQSGVWRIRDPEEETGEIFIASDGVEGNPGRESLANWFKIEKFDGDYKLSFCPSVCELCRPLCRDVGIFFDDGGRRRLALNDVPFKIMFKKA